MRRVGVALFSVCFSVCSLCAASAGVSCGSHAPAAPAQGAARTDPDAVHVVGTTFRDGRGRQLLFRGYNAKVPVLFDVTFDDGRVPEETVPPFTEDVATRIEQLGWNVMRIPVSWSGIEPKPLAYADAFFTQLATVLDMAHRHHFYVIIDMHQDAYSKEIGEDGEPLWAIVPPPTMLLQGPYDDSRRLTGQVLSAGFSFFDGANATDGRPLQQAYVSAVQKVVTRVVGDSAVLGYEAFNEPVVLRQDELDAFHQSLADGVHAIDADAPVLFEPIATRNQSDQAVVPMTPWRSGPGTYAVHIYTGWFSVPSQNDWASQDPNALLPSMQAATNEAAGWATPIFVTEFGCDQSVPQGPKWMSAELDLQDRFLVSSTAWEFAELGTWGFEDAMGHERPATTRVVSRTFPRAVAGDLLAIDRPALGDMIVHYRPTAATQGLEHEVSMSNDYLTSPRILCDGQPVMFATAVGRATFTCPAADGAEHTFEVVGTPVP
jgi:endoglycosylceramidase